MLIEEAKWLGSWLERLPRHTFPALNVGSSSMEFRCISHPWVEERVFGPARQADKEIINVDLHSGPGVDVVADITREADVARLRHLKCPTVIFTNVLEHLPLEPAKSAKTISQLVPPGGMLLVSAPRVYGEHADPIDNGYRPFPEELVALFAGFSVLEAKVVKCRRGAYYFANDGRSWGRYILRMMAPFVKPRNWWRLVKESPLRMSASVAVLQRPSA